MGLRPSDPGKDWEVHLQLRTTPNIKQLYIDPPRVLVLEEEYEENKDHQGDLFKKEAIDVLNFLEKYAGWWFVRVDGQRIGKVCGEVSYAYNNKELGDHIPENIRGFADAPGIKIDCSEDHRRSRPIWKKRTMSGIWFTQKR